MTTLFTAFAIRCIRSLFQHLYLMSLAVLSWGFIPHMLSVVYSVFPILLSLKYVRWYVTFPSWWGISCCAYGRSCNYPSFPLYRIFHHPCLPISLLSCSNITCKDTCIYRQISDPYLRLSLLVMLLFQLFFLCFIVKLLYTFMHERLSFRSILICKCNLAERFVALYLFRFPSEILI